MHHHRIHHQWVCINFSTSRPPALKVRVTPPKPAVRVHFPKHCPVLFNQGWYICWYRKLTWLDGRSTMNEDVFPIENGDFQCHVSFWVGIFLIRLLSSKKSSHIFLLPFPGEEKTRNNSTISSPPNLQIANFPTSQPRKLRKKNCLSEFWLLHLSQNPSVCRDDMMRWCHESRPFFVASRCFHLGKSTSTQWTK